PCAEPGRRSSDLQLLVVKNMTAKTRRLVVRPLLAGEPGALPPPPPGCGFVLDAVFPADVAVAHGAAPRVLDRETEEKIEALEQKVKIAERKNRPEKVDKYRAKLAKLRGAGAGAGAGAVAVAGANAAPAAGLIERLAGDSRLIVTLPPDGDASIPVAVVPRAVAPAPARRPGAGPASGQFVVHEEKDTDNAKVVTVTAELVEGDCAGD
ncbi:hypothetical protein LPJ66_011471, partial [Kickxella alabastrina]